MLVPLVLHNIGIGIFHAKCYPMDIMHLLFFPSEIPTSWEQVGTWFLCGLSCSLGCPRHGGCSWGCLVLNVCSIDRGGGLLVSVSPVDEISQKRNIRCVGFMLLSTTPLSKNVTEGITPPCWAVDPSMTPEAPEVAHCGVNSCRRRPNSIRYGCTKKILCTTHRTQLCMSCDAPVAAPLAPQDVPSSSAVPAAWGVTNGTNGTVPIDFPFPCFFPVNTSTVHFIWLPKKPRMHTPGDTMECPCWEAMHGTREIAPPPSPTPTSSALMLAVCWCCTTWGGGGVRAEW